MAMNSNGKRPPRPPKPPIGPGKPKPKPIKPGKPTRPGDSIMKPLPVKPGIGKPGTAQQRQKQLKTIEDQMKKRKK